MNRGTVQAIPWWEQRWNGFKQRMTSAAFLDDGTFVGEGIVVNSRGRIVASVPQLPIEGGTYEGRFRDGRSILLGLVARDQLSGLVFFDLPEGRYPHASFLQTQQGVLADTAPIFTPSVSSTEIIEGTSLRGIQTHEGFIPGSLITRDLELLQTFGRIVKPFLGVRYRMINEDVMREQHLPRAYGALVGGEPDLYPSIIPGSPAERVGLREHDIITHIDTTPVDESMSLAFLLNQKLPGDPILVQILRDGKKLTRLVVLDEVPF
jgi:hypothetical protein